MPVTDQTPVNSYTGNGVTTVFAYGFRIFEDGDLTVTVDGVTKTLTTHYTVSGAGAALGGSVTFLSAPAADSVIVIDRTLEYARDEDYQESGDLLAQTADDDFDQAIMLIQQVRQMARRSLRFPTNETTDQVLTDAATRASKYLGFDANGDITVLEFAETGSIALPLPIADGGTGAGSASAARTALGLVIGTNVQAYDANLQTAESLQNQSATAYTTGGSSTAYTLTPSAAVSALAENQEFDIEFHTAAGSSPTLAVSGLTAKNLKYRDSTGAKATVTSTQVPSGWRSKVTYDGTDYIVREVPPAAATVTYGTATTTSGATSYTRNIASGVKRVEVAVANVSLNGNTEVMFELGDSGGSETSGCLGSSMQIFAGTPTGTAPTASFRTTSAAAAAVYHGIVTFTLVDAAAFTWAVSGQLYRSDSGAIDIFGGSKSLTSELTTIKMVSGNGSATFDGGTINDAQWT